MLDWISFSMIFYFFFLPLINVSHGLQRAKYLMLMLLVIGGHKWCKGHNYPRAHEVRRPTILVISSLNLWLNTLASIIWNVVYVPSPKRICSHNVHAIMLGWGFWRHQYLSHIILPQNSQNWSYSVYSMKVYFFMRSPLKSPTHPIVFMFFWVGNWLKVVVKSNQCLLDWMQISVNMYMTNNGLEKQFFIFLFQSWILGIHIFA